MLFYVPNNDGTYSFVEQILVSPLQNWLKTLTSSNVTAQRKIFKEYEFNFYSGGKANTGCKNAQWT